jgi:hypothetical protein
VSARPWHTPRSVFAESFGAFTRRQPPTLVRSLVVPLSSLPASTPFRPTACSLVSVVHTVDTPVRGHVVARPRGTSWSLGPLDPFAPSTLVAFLAARRARCPPSFRVALAVRRASSSPRLEAVRAAASAAARACHSLPDSLSCSVRWVRARPPSPVCLGSDRIQPSGGWDSSSRGCQPLTVRSFPSSRLPHPRNRWVRLRSPARPSS